MCGFGRKTTDVLHTALAVALVHLRPLTGALGQCPDSSAERRVSDREVESVIVAIQDEIYVKGYYRLYSELGATPLRLYVQPCRRDGSIWVIYKFLPFGELMRMARESSNGELMLLAGESERGFPLTQGDVLRTLYMDDDKVISMKTTWRRFSFRIDYNPGPTVLAAAQERQGKRERTR